MKELHKAYNIKAHEAILQVVHKQILPQRPTSFIRDSQLLYIFCQMFEQQLSLSPGFLQRGILVQNWILIQDVAKNVKDKHQKNNSWFKSVIQALWKFYQTA